MPPAPRRAVLLAAALCLACALASRPLLGEAERRTDAVEGQAGPRPVPALDAAGIVRALHAGQVADALAAITRASAAESAGHGRGIPSVAGLALLAAALIDSWAPAAALDPAQLGDADRASYWYVRGVLAGRAAWPGGQPDHVARARAAAAELERLAAPVGEWNRTAVRRASVLATIAAAQEERQELALLLTHALQSDAQLREVGLPDDDVLPADEVAGDLWLQVHRFADALAHYRVATSRHPERTRAWIGRARAAREANEHGEAAEAARRVLAAYADAPGQDRLLAEMRDLVARGQP